VRYARRAVLTCALYRDGRLEEDLDPDRVPQVLAEDGGVVWLDLVDPDGADLTRLQERFGFHALAIEDVRHRGQRAKVDTFDAQGYSYLVMYGLSGSPHDLVKHEIHAFASPRFLVTVRYSPIFDLAQVLKRWELHAEMTRHGGGFLLYVLLDEVVDSYLDMVERFEDASEAIESRVFEAEPDRGVQEDIFHLKKHLLALRRGATPLREVLDLLQEGLGLVTDPLRPYFRDVADHVIRTLEFVDNVRELLTVALEAHLSHVGNRLNEVAKRVTSWAAIILIPTLIAGIYGMNFVRPFPSFESPAGFWIAIAMMVLSAGALYWVFRRRGWL
jgi:magnesium transporter